MKVGKISETVLKRSIFKQIHTKRDEVLLGAGVGEDCAAVKLAPGEIFVISTDPITGTVKDVGMLAIQITANDLASSGAEPVGVMLTILLPEGSALAPVVETINSLWQRELSLFFSVEQAPAEEYRARLEAGDYAIALAPVSCADGSAYSLLRSFGAEGLGCYSDVGYENLLAQSVLAADSEVRCALLAQAEARLLEQCVAVPLFSQEKRLLVADGVEGLVFDPYGPILDLTWTTKE